MSCVISDIALSLAADDSTVPAAGATVTVAPTSRPIFVDVSGEFRQIDNPVRELTTATDGSWSVTLPWQSESDPDSLQWAITTPDGFTWTGTVPEGVPGPLTLHALKVTYGWAVASNVTEIPIAIAGLAAVALTVATSGDLPPAASVPGRFVFITTGSVLKYSTGAAYLTVATS